LYELDLSEYANMCWILCKSLSHSGGFE